jgi:hypothetical protein
VHCCGLHCIEQQWAEHRRRNILQSLQTQSCTLSTGPENHRSFSSNFHFHIMHLLFVAWSNLKFIRKIFLSTFLYVHLVQLKSQENSISQSDLKPLQSKFGHRIKH